MYANVISMEHNTYTTRRGQRAHEGMSSNAKGHMRAPKGTVLSGRRLERTLVCVHTFPLCVCKFMYRQWIQDSVLLSFT